MTRTVKKQKISATIDVSVVNAIDEIRLQTKYSNFSAVLNETLKAGLVASGISLEA